MALGVMARLPKGRAAFKSGYVYNVIASTPHVFRLSESELKIYFVGLLPEPFFAIDTCPFFRSLLRAPLSAIM